MILQLVSIVWIRYLLLCSHCILYDLMYVITPRRQNNNCSEIKMFDSSSVHNKYVINTV